MLLIHDPVDVRVCVHACVSQLDDGCADSGGVSVTDSVVNWPVPLEPNLEQHSPKSLNLLLRPNTHKHTHACAQIFPAAYVPLVAGRAGFDREWLAPYHVYWSLFFPCFFQGGAGGGLQGTCGTTHKRTHQHTHTGFTCRSMLCWHIFAIYVVSAHIDWIYSKISQFFFKVFLV